MAEVPPKSVLELAEQLSKGFTALSDEYQQLFLHQRQLERKLSFAKQQYLDLLKRCAPETMSQDHLSFLQDLERAGEQPSGAEEDWRVGLSSSTDPEKQAHASHIKLAESSASLLVHQRGSSDVRIWNGSSADGDMQSGSVPINSTGLGHLERDFTTPGTPSRLGCPFASRSGKQSPLVTPRSSTSRTSLCGRRSKRPSFNDPIRAEICGNDPVSTAASIEGSAPVCPIRFLDQHAPEEVAQYFENHKHEIPRSHEICIKRFQSNAESIRQLDAKYGNLVSMIQGLGHKHQPWLPKDPEDAAENPLEGDKPDEMVTQWAKAVSASLQDAPLADEPESPEDILPETRTAHFDRPLKEIRVGESPSRPWGIPVPSKYAKADSASAESIPTASPVAAEAPMVNPSNIAKCPFDHIVNRQPPQSKASDAAQAATVLPQKEHNNGPLPAPTPHPEQNKHADASPKPFSQVIFNGPVFIGYPPEQAMHFFQSSFGARPQ